MEANIECGYCEIKNVHVKDSSKVLFYDKETGYLEMVSINDEEVFGDLWIEFESKSKSKRFHLKITEIKTTDKNGNVRTSNDYWLKRWNYKGERRFAGGF